MKSGIIALLALLMVCGAAQAAPFSVELGGYRWWQRYYGYIGFRNVELNFRNDLNMNNEGNNVFFLQVEHPIPILPNLLVQYTDISVDGTRQLSRGITIDNIRYTGNVRLDSEINLAHTDATVYWKLFDSFAHVKLGLTGRVFKHRWAGLDSIGAAIASDEGGQKIASRDFGKKARVDLNGILPMVYVGAMFDLPWTGLSAGADANGVIWKASHLFDGRVRLAYTHDSGVGAELGWRRFDLDYDDADNKTRLVVDGAYLSLLYHF